MAANPRPKKSYPRGVRADQLKVLEQLVTAQEAKLLELQKRVDVQSALVLALSEALIPLSEGLMRQDGTIKDMLKSISVLLGLEKARQDEVGKPVPPPKDIGVSEVA